MDTNVRFMHLPSHDPLLHHIAKSIVWLCENVAKTNHFWEVFENVELTIASNYTLTDLYGFGMQAQNVKNTKILWNLKHNKEEKQYQQLVAIVTMEDGVHVLVKMDTFFM
jgi:hypothetical protein